MNDETAFPAQALGGLGYTTGMTLRDYFAAKAMQSIVSRGVVEQVPLEVYASNAYKMADAMMAYRDSGE